VVSTTAAGTSSTSSSGVRVNGADHGRDAAFGDDGVVTTPASAETTAAAAASAAEDGIVAVDDDGIIRYANAAAAALLARPVEQLIGHPFGLPLVADQPAEIEVIRPGRDSVAVDMRVTITILHQSRLHVATLRDITRRRQSERDLKAALERQNIVVGIAAHELHNPLYGIRMLVETLRDPHGGLTAARRNETINDVCDRIDGLQVLLRKLLTASRIDTKPEQPAVAPVPVLEVLLERLAEFGDKAQRVRVDCPGDLAVLAHRSELAEMIDNYLDNAFAHGRPPVTVYASQQHHRVQLRVCDHGPGVPDTFVSQLFQRFSRPPPEQCGSEGTGLGLWIVASLAAGNDGHAWYEPRPGGGSCFCLDLPQAPSESGHDDGLGGRACRPGLTARAQGPCGVAGAGTEARVNLAFVPLTVPGCAVRGWMG
jgi:signal transduction histidine kinase